MYQEQPFLSHANAVFSEIRNTPLESLNTGSFRLGLQDALEAAGKSAGDDPRQLERLRHVASSYKVHFLSLEPPVSAPRQASVYTFDGFPGLCVVRNYLTEDQCHRLMCQTLCDYINVGCATLISWDASWGTRTYRGYSPFPDPLVRLTRCVLSHFDSDYIPDAAIINCYSKSYFLRLHKDDAEETDDCVVNISLGAPAIFMLGGVDHGTVPVSFVVDSGSVVLMSQSSRFCLHGIVKLLSYNKPGIYHNRDCPDNGAAAAIPAYAFPKFEKTIPQCPDQALSGIAPSDRLMSSVQSLSKDLRVSISIRRAKVRPT
ncbi:alkylated DNA repair protein, putative [Babesia ovis]|uniref:Alkylated DNA repair protein, putative n=1 Tax=Babesia ovis TaxID=5869 RepID=A0A9W5TD51_BABOV|nr:alkylated DNA repair protein, putative [Babesia ovis]